VVFWQKKSISVSKLCEKPESIKGISVGFDIKSYVLEYTIIAGNKNK
jgi:hypothetical protein